jgi:ASC-1-like (ASCH) protein
MRRGQVTKPDQDALRDKVDALSARIEMRVREIKQYGAFSGIREAGMEEIRKRSVTIKERLDAAIAKGNRWGILKYELERDFHSLNEDFARFERRLDAGTMKQSGKASVA